VHFRYLKPFAEGSMMNPGMTLCQESYRKLEMWY